MALLAKDLKPGDIIIWTKGDYFPIGTKIQVRVVDPKYSIDSNVMEDVVNQYNGGGDWPTDLNLHLVNDRGLSCCDLYIEPEPLIIKSRSRFELIGD